MNSTTETRYKMRVAVKKVEYMFEAWPAIVKLHHLLCEFIFTTNYYCLNPINPYLSSVVACEYSAGQALSSPDMQKPYG